jgi:hypothetical protein
LALAASPGLAFASAGSVSGTLEELDELEELDAAGGVVPGASPGKGFAAAASVGFGVSPAEGWAALLAGKGLAAAAGVWACVPAGVSPGNGMRSDALAPTGGGGTSPGSGAQLTFFVGTQGACVNGGGGGTYCATTLCAITNTIPLQTTEVNKARRVYRLRGAPTPSDRMRASRANPPRHSAIVATSLLKNLA